MRKIAAVAVAVVTTMTMLTGTASAAVVGPYKTKAACEKVRAEYAKKVKTGPCLYSSTKKAWYFKY